MNPAYTYSARVTRVVDGDTLDATVDLGFHVQVALRFRFLGLDAPEIRGPEREDGLACKLFLEELVENRHVTIQTHKTGKYGRWLAQVWVGDFDVNQALREWIAENMATEAS